ncbi:MAG: hypothetical protein ANABAC_1283 [Anaerolineae bacterium]|nr:MAG: hypothetical protein ANABAC_1283 [Anaerolineae bacterium]
MSEITINLEALAEPFPARYIEWKPGAISKNKDRALALAYVDARRYQERLDFVCPEWSSRVELLADGRVAKVSLTIMGITREEVGEASGEDANTVTTAVAQAFKRACAAFGLGRYLYHIPQQWYGWDDTKKQFTEQPRLPDWALAPGDFDLSEMPKAPPQKPTQAPVAAAPTPTAKTVPTPAASAPANPYHLPGDDPANFVVPFGRNKGKSLSQIWETGKDGIGWVKWAANDYQPKSEADAITQRMARAYLLLQGLNPPKEEDENVPF